MLLVAGATGFLGGEICRRLSARGHAVRGLIRSTSDSGAVAALRLCGVEITTGDLKDPASLSAACRGATTVLSTASATRTRQPGDGIERTDHQGQLDLIEAAQQAGVSRFVYISFSGGIGGDSPLAQAKRDVERRLRESGMTCAILRPTYFMEAWLSPALGFDYPNAAATIYGSGENRISWISLGDVAEFAVRCAESPEDEHTTLELGGPEGLSPIEVVRLFEKASGRRFAIRQVPKADLEASLAVATDPLERTFAALMLGVARGDAIAMEETLRRYPMSLRTVSEYAHDVLSAARAP